LRVEANGRRQQMRALTYAVSDDVRCERCARIFPGSRRRLRIDGMYGDIGTDLNHHHRDPSRAA
jgi:hypothetical protein